MRNWVRRRPVSRCRGNGVGVCEVDFLCELLAWGLAFIIFSFQASRALSLPSQVYQKYSGKIHHTRDFLYSEEFIVFNDASMGPSLPS